MGKFIDSEDLKGFSDEQAFVLVVIVLWATDERTQKNLEVAYCDPLQKANLIKSFGQLRKDHFDFEAFVEFSQQLQADCMP